MWCGNRGGLGVGEAGRHCLKEHEPNQKKGSYEDCRALSKGEEKRKAFNGKFARCSPFCWGNKTTPLNPLPPLKLRQQMSVVVLFTVFFVLRSSLPLPLMLSLFLPSFPLFPFLSISPNRHSEHMLSLGLSPSNTFALSPVLP